MAKANFFPNSYNKERGLNSKCHKHTKSCQQVKLQSFWQSYGLNWIHKQKGIMYIVKRITSKDTTKGKLYTSMGWNSV